MGEVLEDIGMYWDYLFLGSDKKIGQKIEVWFM